MSSDLEIHLPNNEQMMESTKSHIERLRSTVTLNSNPKDKKDQPLLPIFFGEFSPNDAENKIRCAYGHLDEKPAKMEDG